MRIRDAVIWGIAGLLLLPVLVNPAGWIVGLVIVALWLLVTYGGGWLLEVEKTRRQGERGAIHQVRSKARDRRDRE